MKKFFEYYDKVIRILLIAATAGFVTICIAQVFVRFVLGGSIVWAQEMCNLLFYTAIFLGAAACVTERRHITIDLVLQKLPRPVLRWWMLAIYALELFFALFLVVYGYKLAVAGVVQISSTLNLSFRVIYAAIPFSGLVMAINIIRIAIKDFTVTYAPGSTGEQPDNGGPIL